MDKTLFEIEVPGASSCGLSIYSTSMRSITEACISKSTIGNLNELYYRNGWSEDGLPPIDYISIDAVVNNSTIFKNKLDAEFYSTIALDETEEAQSSLDSFALNPKTNLIKPYHILEVLEEDCLIDLYSKVAFNVMNDIPGTSWSEFVSDTFKIALSINETYRDLAYDNGVDIEEPTVARLGKIIVGQTKR